jgi:translation initiation factor 2A
MVAVCDEGVWVNDVLLALAAAPFTAEPSPLGKFLCTFTRPDLGQVYCDGALVFTARSKKPSLHFSSDELLAAHCVSSEIRVLSTATWEPLLRLPVDGGGVGDFSMSPQSTPALAPVVAAFVPGQKSGKPAYVCVYKGAERVAHFPTFRADEATFKWSPDGSRCLCKIETTVDATGQSYYGESQLILLFCDKAREPVQVQTKEGAVHDFSWNPSGQLFCASAGKSPPKCTLYDGLSGSAVYEFGDVHRNTVCFSPQGRFLALAGFGNLAGDMDFWDVKRKKKLGSGKADAAVGYGWSPDGRVFMTCTLAPRMNVDNLVALYSYRGRALRASPGARSNLRT